MEHYYCVIMSGGVGSRFWPISRQSRPKQFLDFFGTGSSLLQDTYRRFLRIVPEDHIYIVTHADYVALTLEQLPALKREQILTEPLRRNTAPCIAYACYHIQQRDPKASIVVAASDHIIMNEDNFVQTVSQSLRFAALHPYLLTLGIKPTAPETGYGYIQVDSSERALDGQYHKVKVFTEKPNREMAEIFVSCGEFLWNSGMFVWHVKTILDAFAKYMPEVSRLFTERASDFGTEREQEAIEEIYPYCPSTSIDYGVLEKADNVLVTPATFGWADLGTWGALYEQSTKDQTGNVTNHEKTRFYESMNNILYIDDPNLLAVVQGVDDCIIAKHGNVLLICKREAEQSIKNYVTDVEIESGEDYI